MPVVAGEVQRLAEPHAGPERSRGMTRRAAIRSVPIIAHGMTGAPDSSAIRATPVLPR